MCVNRRIKKKKLRTLLDLCRSVVVDGRIYLILLHAHQELNEFFQTCESIEYTSRVYGLRYRILYRVHRVHRKRKENKRGYWITTCAALESIKSNPFSVARTF